MWAIWGTDDMATIHYLADHTERAAGRPPVNQAAATGSAEIMLFTGVRYERWTDAAEAPAAPSEQPCVQAASKNSAQG
jgi:hypothetical protein